MKDRAALDAFLQSAGFSSVEDLRFAPASGMVKEVSREEHTVVATISTQTKDRYGDILVAGGARLDRFRANPVVLYAHALAGLPVARSLWERVEGDSVVASPRFHLDTGLSRETWALVENGILSAWSVGFVPEEWTRDEEEDAFKVLKWDLLEYSVVPVPANFEALTHALKEARISAPILVRSLKGLGLVAPDLVPQAVKRAPDKVPAAEEEDTMPETLKQLTLEQLEAERPDLVGQLKAAGQEEEAAKAAEEKAKADAGKAKAEAEKAQTEVEKLAQATADGAEAERKRLVDLKAAFPERTDFAVEQFEKGASVPEAQAAFRDVQLAELKAENAKLKRALPEGAEPVGVNGVPDSPKNARSLADELQTADPKLSRTEALRTAHRQLEKGIAG